MSAATRARALISVDVGGTFTDVLHIDAAGTVRCHKFPSDNAQQQLCDLLQGDSKTEPAGIDILYSTTAALNALLAHAIPPIGLIVTRGFRDILETARLPAQSEDPTSPLPPRLVPLEHVREISARIHADGSVQQGVERAEVATVAHDFATAGIDVIAICLLHSYVNASHEDEVADIITATEPTTKVIRSSAVLPALREYDRTLVTALNAVAVPVLESHLSELSEAVGRPCSSMQLMQANGALASYQHIAAHPMSTALAGPRAAVVGTHWYAGTQAIENLITFDVGGTSTDIAVMADSKLPYTNRARIAGYEIPGTVLDVTSIGAGGGSLATVAADRRWRVGPESAGSTPVPCVIAAAARYRP